MLLQKRGVAPNEKTTLVARIALSEVIIEYYCSIIILFTSEMLDSLEI